MLLIFDENFPQRFSDAFSILEEANKRSEFRVNVKHAINFMDKKGASDEEIIKKASRQKAVIITHDNDFKRIKHYRPLLIEHEVGYIYFKVPKGKYQFWDIVKAFINIWEDLKRELSSSPPPFAIEINKQGKLTKLSF